MVLPTTTLKEILVKSGLVTVEDFDSAAASANDTGKSIEDILVFRGLLTSNVFSKLVADHLGVPFIDSKNIEVSSEVLQIVPQNLAKTYKLVPVMKKDNTLVVAMDDPMNVEAVEFVKRLTHLTVQPAYASPEDLRRLLALYKKNFQEEFDQIIKEAALSSKSMDITKSSESVPIIKILDTIMEYSVAERASDVHVETQEHEVIIRFRIDGDLQDMLKLPRGVEESLVARIKILSNLKLDEKRVPQDGRYKIVINDEVVALRVSIIPGFYGENVVMRLLRESARPASFGELGIVAHNSDLMQKAIEAPHGMLLVTGPTGSGKTTTLYSVLTILNNVDVKICTIEDPVEYGVNRVTQIQVNSKVGLDFAAGLRSLLRHDPDIIMVGEIRDKETAEIAVHSALTGHLVLSTLHTNDAPGAIPRLLDMGVEPYLVASTVNLVLAQRLVRKICSQCVTSYTPDQATLHKLSELGISTSGQKFYKGAGCDACNHTGFKGRVGIYEALSVTEEIRALIASKATADKILEQAVKQGMVTMLVDGLNKVSSGITTIDQVISAVAVHK